MKMEPNDLFIKLILTQNGQRYERDILFTREILTNLEVVEKTANKFILDSIKQVIEEK